MKIFVFRCRDKKSKVVRKVNTQVKNRYLKKVFELLYFSPLITFSPND